MCHHMSSGDLPRFPAKIVDKRTNTPKIDRFRRVAAFAAYRRNRPSAAGCARYAPSRCWCRRRISFPWRPALHPPAGPQAARPSPPGVPPLRASSVISAPPKFLISAHGGLRGGACSAACGAAAAAGKATGATDSPLRRGGRLRRSHAASARLRTAPGAAHAAASPGAGKRPGAVGGEMPVRFRPLPPLGPAAAVPPARRFRFRPSGRALRVPKCALPLLAPLRPAPRLARKRAARKIDRAAEEAKPPGEAGEPGRPPPGGWAVAAKKQAFYSGSRPRPPCRRGNGGHGGRNMAKRLAKPAFCTRKGCDTVPAPLTTDFRAASGAARRAHWGWRVSWCPSRTIIPPERVCCQGSGRARAWLLPAMGYPCSGSTGVSPPAGG